MRNLRQTGIAGALMGSFLASPIAQAVAITILIAIGAAAAGHGRPQDRPTFRGGVDLIDVDVVATGRNGEPVRDLTAADFELLEDGRPQEIRTFAVVDIPVAGRGADKSQLDVEPDVTTNAEREGRLYVILLDTPSTAYLQS